MTMVCKVCSHPERLEIDREIVKGRKEYLYHQRNKGVCPCNHEWGKCMEYADCEEICETKHKTDFKQCMKAGGAFDTWEGIQEEKRIDNMDMDDLI